MKYYLVSLLCILIITGCGGNSRSDSNTVSSADSNIDNTSTSSSSDTSDQEIIDYNLMTCENELSDAIVLINQLRAQSQTCGDTSYPAVEEVFWSSTLTFAATEHSDNMANYNFFSHTGLDGSTVGTRVTAQGYKWSRVSENIAAGQTSVQDVVDGWMSSEGHCTNIMDADVSEMGLACQVNSDSDYQRYWTQVFANKI